MLVSKNCLVCIDCLVFIGCSVNLLSCLHWLRVTLNIQATFPVICLLILISKTDLSTLLSCFKWLFSIIDYLVYTDYTVHIDYFNWFPHWMSCLERCPVCIDCVDLSGCSVLSTILSTQTSCNFTILLTFPVICLLNACFKELSCLHWLSCFYWLFC